jgi:hypothetical protein
LNWGLEAEGGPVIIKEIERREGKGRASLVPSKNWLEFGTANPKLANSFSFPSSPFLLLP